MKYVAFLDILGFKASLKKMSQSDAKKYIEKFSSTIYSAFIGYSDIEGFVVSDSLLLYTKDDKPGSLSRLLELTRSICEAEFTDNGILLRGAIAKGEFDYIPGIELSSLRKQLIVGQAYVEAYMLESSVKTIGVILSESVYKDIIDNGISITTTEEVIDKDSYYVFIYLTIDFLFQEVNLRQFVSKAEDAKWLPHYYNALAFTLKGARGKKVESAFDSIINTISRGKPTEYWKEIDIFIENAYATDVIATFKQRLSKYLREKMFSMTGK